MKRISINKTNLQPHFIGSWAQKNEELCDQLIQYFERNREKHKKGTTASGVNLESKNSMDISISPKDLKQEGNEIFNTYFQNLFECYKDYMEQWPFLKTFANKLDIGKFNLQRYLKGQHFNGVHSERTNLETSHRVFAWMTYLNDVNESGETYFSHYDVSIKPQKGLTLIWPADWTHAHKGHVINYGSKYIITGWMNLPTEF